MIGTVRKIRYYALILLEKFEKLMDRNFKPRNSVGVSTLLCTNWLKNCVCKITFY